MKIKLNKYRKRVDRIDKLIIRLLRYRLKTSKKIGDEKSALHLSAYSPEREKAINNSIKKNVPEKDLTFFISKIYERIMDVTREFQKTPPEPQKKVSLKKALSKKEWFLIIALFFLLLSLLWYTFFTKNSSASPYPVKFEIGNGEGFSTVTEIIYEKGLIPSKFNFKVAGFISGAERNVKAGRYTITRDLSYIELIEILVEGKGDRLYELAIADGPSIRGLAKLFDSYKITPADSFIALIDDRAFITSLGLDAPSLEGYLLPGKYHFFEKSTAAEVIQKMHGRLTALLTDSLTRRANELGYSVHQILTLASIVEGETNYKPEMPAIAGVYINRLKRGMKLQADPTVQYLQTNGWKKRLKHSDLRVDSPYNTYQVFGLPPGPINNPGREAILAVLFHEEHNYIFFVADGSGGHKFSTSFGEHQRLAREYYKYLREKIKNEKK
ncbi:MAG: endolytic transglycosylase MltG [Ignavibacteriaceae bacterium]